MLFWDVMQTCRHADATADLPVLCLESFVNHPGQSKISTARRRRRAQRPDSCINYISYLLPSTQTVNPEIDQALPLRQLTQVARLQSQMILVRSNLSCQITGPLNHQVPYYQERTQPGSGKEGIPGRACSLGGLFELLVAAPDVLRRPERICH